MGNRGSEQGMMMAATGTRVYACMEPNPTPQTMWTRLLQILIRICSESHYQSQSRRGSQCWGGESDCGLTRRLVLAPLQLMSDDVSFLALSPASDVVQIRLSPPSVHVCPSRAYEQIHDMSRLCEVACGLVM